MSDVRIVLIIACCFLFTLNWQPSTAYAKPVDADLDVRSVDIDHNFAGMDLLLYGARNDIGRIVVVLRGPDKHYLVRRKERIGGIWMNRKSVEFQHVPGFYTAATTNDLDEIKNDQLLAALGVGADHLRMQVVEEQKTLKSEETVKEFRAALLKHMDNVGLYRIEFSDVSFMGETLFRTWLEFPKNILRGWYTAEVFLFSDGKLTAVQTIPIEVSKIGFEALVFDFAHHQQWLYGILCVFVALGAGWLSNKLFKRG